MFGRVCRSALRRATAIAAISAGLVGSALGANAGRFMEVNGWANPPVGHLAFCKAVPAECVAQGASGPVELDAARWLDLQNVNLGVNSAVAPATDLQIYAAEELWALPAGQGDCEDYALSKRKKLVERGWPTSALVIAVVFDENGDGHAVLVARTSHGDFILDNKVDEIRPWYQTPYRYVKRQSDADPRRWVSVGHGRSPARSTAAAQ